jgi:predicted benzoate:H+ symporter BenE
MRPSSRSLLGLVIVALVVLTAQGWTGDFVNLFAVFPSGVTDHTLAGFTQALAQAGRMEVTHATVGTLLLVLAIVILFVTLRSAANSGVRICAVLGFVAICSAAYGGISFVLSGFLNNGNSAQMGGSFIGAYASYFLVLYFNKK